MSITATVPLPTRFISDISCIEDITVEDGDTTIRLWSNLPEEIGAGQVAALYRARWRVDIDQSWRFSRVIRWVVGPAVRHCG